MDEVASPPPHYGTATGFALTVNYIIGTGAFALPYSVVQAGTILSLVCISMFTFISAICLCYVLESMARAGGIIQAEKTIRQRLSTLKHHMPGSTGEAVTDAAHTHNTHSHSLTTTTTTTSSESSPLLVSVPPSSSSSDYVPQIGYNKIDFVTMSLLFGGRPALILVHVCIALYSYGVLWAYASVFSSSVNTLFFQYVLNEECNIYLPHSWACSVGYAVCVLSFAVIVTFLSLKDMQQQAGIQTILTFYRFSAFAAMILTCIIALYYPNHFDPNARQSTPTIAHLAYLDWKGFGLIFCTTAVALDVHWNVPDVLAPLRNKAVALRMVLAALLCSAVFYAVIAIVCTLEFGAATLPLVTLNWSHYTGEEGGFYDANADAAASSAIDLPSTDAMCLSILVKLFIILFPVCNQCSVYPLVVLTLSDNYYSLLPESYHQRYTPYTLKTLCRLLSCLPPIALALCFGQLDVIFAVTGLFAFALEFIIPCLLQLQSCKWVRDRYGEGAEYTVYSSWVSEPSVVWVMLICGCVAFLISIVASLMGYSVA